MLFEKPPLAQSLVIDSAMNTQDFTQTNGLRCQSPVSALERSRGGKSRGGA